MVSGSLLLQLVCVSVTPLPPARSSPPLMISIQFVFMLPTLYLSSLTNPIISMHMLSGFMWCQKEMVCSRSKQKTSFILRKFDSGRKPAQHRPTWMFRCNRPRHTNLIIYIFLSLSASFRRSFFYSARKSEGGERVLNKVAEGMHSQEVIVGM